MTAYGFKDDTERFSSHLELIRACFGRDEYDAETAEKFAASVGADQRLFLPFAMSVLMERPEDEVLKNWHSVRSVLGCIAVKYNMDSKLELGEKIGL